MATSNRILVVDSQKFDEKVNVLPNTLIIKVESHPDFPYGFCVRADAERMRYPKERFYLVKLDAAKVLFNAPFPTVAVRTYPFSRSSNEYKEFSNIIERIIDALFTPYIAAKSDYKSTKNGSANISMEAGIIQVSNKDINKLFGMKLYGGNVCLFVEYQGSVYKSSEIGKGLQKDEQLRMLEKVIAENEKAHSFLIVDDQVYEYFCKRRTLGFDSKKGTLYITDHWGFKTLLELKAVKPETNLSDVVDPSSDIKGNVGYVPLKKGNVVRITEACTQARYRGLIGKVTQDQDSCWIRVKVEFPWGYKLPELYYTGLEQLKRIPETLINYPQLKS